MRTFRSKSFAFRASKNEPAWDPFLDLEPIEPPPGYDTLSRSSDAGRRPLTAQSGLDRRGGRASFSRPRTATIFSRHTLLAKSLRRHDIDPHDSSLVDDDCIGVALTSPNQNPSMIGPLQFNRIADHARIESNIHHGEAPHHFEEEGGLRRRQSTWRAVGGLFGRKRHDRDSQVPPLPTVHNIQSGYVETREPAKGGSPADETYTPRFSSHFSRRRKSEAGHRPRKSLTLRRAPKTAQTEPDVPELPRFKADQVEPPSLKEVSIPSSNMDRFSVMFAPVLQNHCNQPLVVPTVVRQRADSPVALETSTPTGHHHRSATAPSYLPSPTHPSLPPPSRAAPPPPVPPLEYEQPMFANDSRTGSALSRRSSSSTLRSSLSFMSSDLEQYYLPARYHISHDAASSSSSQSTPTTAIFSDPMLKPAISHSPNTDASFHTARNYAAVDSDANSSPTFSTQYASQYTSTEPATELATKATSLMLPSPPPSAYLSARAFPASPAASSPTHGYGYDAPHSPLVEVARSVTATTTRPRVYSARPPSESSSGSASGHASTRADGGSGGVNGAPSGSGRGVCLSDSRCGTPVVVQVVGPGRRVSHWGMVVGEDVV